MPGETGATLTQGDLVRFGIEDRDPLVTALQQILGCQTSDLGIIRLNNITPVSSLRTPEKPDSRDLLESFNELRVGGPDQLTVQGAFGKQAMNTLCCD